MALSRRPLLPNQMLLPLVLETDQEQSPVVLEQMPLPVVPGMKQGLSDMELSEDKKEVILIIL